MNSQDLNLRLEVAKRLVLAKHYDEALEHFLWLWQASRDLPGWGGARLSFLLSDTSRLAKLHEPARKAFFSIMDKLEAGFESGQVPQSLDWREWSSMCGSFGEDERKIAWYEKERDADGRLFAAQASDLEASHVIDDLFTQLVEMERAEDALRLIGDPIARAEELISSYKIFNKFILSMNAETREVGVPSYRRQLTKSIGQLYGALLVTGNQDMATATADLLLQTLDTPSSRLALVRHGSKISQQVLPEFVLWLDQAEAAGAKVAAERWKLKRLAKKSGALDSE